MTGHESWKSIIIAAVILCVALSVPAGAVAAGKMGLNDCVAEALRVSFSVKKAEAEIEAAGQRVKQAKADYLPVFSTSYTYGYLSPERTTSGRVTTPHNNFSFELVMTQPIFTGFRLDINKKLQELGLMDSELALVLARLDLVLSVKQAYYNILAAEKSVMVAQQSVEALESQLNVAKNFFEVGMTPRSDLLEAEVELANGKKDLITAQNSVRLAKSQLNNILRRPVNQEVEVMDVSEMLPEAPEFNEAEKAAMSNRPEIKRAEKGVEQAEQGIRLAQAAFYPTLNFQASYEKGGDDPLVQGYDYTSDETTTLGLSLGWTIWDWRKRDYSVAEYRSLLRKSRYSLHELEELISLEVKAAVLAIRENREAIVVAKKGVESGEEGFRMSQERYKEQVATSTEVLNAQTRLTSARTNYFSALYGYHLALAQLRRAMGEQ